MLAPLSLPLSGIKRHYDVVVVGSGYGAAIAASRMARAGRTVCVLERGREIRPGEYPDTPLEAARELQVELAGARVGERTAMFDFRRFDDIGVLVGCGLGGTSLINANVSLRADPRVFQDPRWPAGLRADPSLLEQGYDRATRMLAPTPYPESEPRLAKLEALERSAERLKAPFSRPPINVTFQDGPNAAGVEQKACIGCGDCVSGCNVGAKNTVLMNYLPDACAFGAEIFTQVAVERVARGTDAPWRVYFQPLEVGREEFGAPPMFVTADVVMLGAGALGSTEILLRSADARVDPAERLPLSPRLGERFTGNGDVLGFGYNNDMPIRGVGTGSTPVAARERVGPCITGLVDLRGTARMEDGMVIEEGSIPRAIADFLPRALALASKTFGRDTDPGVDDLVAERLREVDSLVNGPYAGAVHHTQTFLVMSHDDGGGKVALDEDTGRLRLRWKGVGSQAVFTRVSERLLEATRANGGTFVSNPEWSDLFPRDLITVHPLGGCAMADDAERGVADHKGQVFAGSAGTAVHEGLYVCDGAVIPRPLGVNPLLTISALAERCCALAAADRGWVIDYDTVRPPRVTTKRPGIRFTEKMAGHFAAGYTGADFHEAARTAAVANSPMEFTVTIESDDVEAMLTDPGHPARLAGTVAAPALSREALTVTRGEFNLFPPDPDRPEARQMRYRMRLRSVEGRDYFLSGFKAVHDDHELDAWPDLTTLFLTVHQGSDASGAVAGRGLLRIRPADFARQLASIAVTGEPDAAKRLRYLARFGRFFAGTVLDTYGGVFAGLARFDPAAPPRRRRPLRASAPEIHALSARDGTALRLTRYRGGAKGPVLLAHGLGVSSQIFSTDTVDTNLVEYLFAHGYDVWLLDYRASIALPASRTQFNGDDVAEQDFPAAVDAVRALTGAASVQVVAHCFGASTFTMAMMAGLRGVRSAVISQVSAHVVAPASTRLKAWLHMPRFLRVLGADALNARAQTDAGLAKRMYDSVLRLSPTQREELCQSATCHRITFMYAPLYEHDRLNALTHDSLHEMFGIANVEAFDHLARMVRAGRVVGARGDDRYMPHLERLAIPITFIHGAENACYLPRSTELTLDALRSRNGAGLYRRQVIPGYGHIDCILGKDAARDVFPFVLAQLEATPA